jgi:hypothetical protein
VLPTHWLIGIVVSISTPERFAQTAESVAVPGSRDQATQDPALNARFLRIGCSGAERGTYLH